MNGTANQPNLLELAKQGNPQAIATLMNRQLQPKGITAKAALKNGCLQIMLESAQAPNQQALVEFISKGLTSLEATSIQQVKVYGRQVGEDFPVWSQEIEIGAQSNPFSDFSSYQNKPSHLAYTPENKNSYHADNKQQPWFEQEINIFLFVLFFWPVGIYLMWKYSKTSTPAKWIITFICSLFSIAAIS